jgi:sulfur carrier protein ThiS
MQVSVAISGRTGEQIMELNEGSTPLELLQELNLYPDEVLILSRQDGDRPIPINTRLRKGDSILIVPVASGG